MRRIRYIPQIMQTECGLCCIAMIADYYGHHVTLSELREYQQPGRDGISLKHLCEILDWIHFDHAVYRGNIASLAAIKAPFIVYFSEAHFVVVEKVSPKFIYVVDPVQGRVPYSYEEMESLFSGIILTAYPAKDLKRKPKERSVWWQFLPLFLKEKWLVLGILFFSGVSYGTTLLMPALTERIINGTGQFSVKLVAAAAAVIAGYGLANLLNGFSNVLLRTNIFRNFYVSIIEKMGKLKYRYFESRPKSAILYSLNCIENVNQFYASSFIRFFIVVGALIVQLGYVASRSFSMMWILVILIILYSITVRTFNQFAVRLNQTATTGRTRMNQVQMEYMDSIESIKVSGVEDVYLERWIKELDGMIKKTRETDLFSSANSTISGVLVTAIPLAILFVGVWMSYHVQGFLIGTAVALYSVANLAVAYAGEVISIINSFEMVGAYMDRIKDIVVQKEQVPGSRKVDALKDIEVRGVNFRYDRHAPTVLDGINMRFSPGEKIAIVGGSGSGKSTIAKLIMGLYSPFEGHLYYNDIPENELDYTSLRGKLFMIPQEGTLFSGNIRKNLTFFNHDCTEKELLDACRSMQILDDIMGMPMKFETPMSEIGTNISGGQKQRIILARAILAKPTFLILDEATSALDAVTERAIYQELRKLDCTQIVIAHRLSTIEDADRIYVMKGGKLVEEGKHEELLAKGGEYARLYQSSLLDTEGAEPPADGE